MFNDPTSNIDREWFNSCIEMPRVVHIYQYMKEATVLKSKTTRTKFVSRQLKTQNAKIKAIKKLSPNIQHTDVIVSAVMLFHLASVFRMKDVIKSLPLMFFLSNGVFLL